MITFLVKDAKKRAEDKGVVFNEAESRKKNEAWLPIILFYVLLYMMALVAPNLIIVEFYLIGLFGITISGLNHYYEWIKFVKED
ncbi:MAG: hypothetical protein ACJZ2B_00765 [Candidatus Neomarinimicrobiota bacterium]|tara:strand:- start:1716 stop:1967 length:252 start_codon:yes stop_codon:yes gene_type:complete